MIPEFRRLAAHEQDLLYKAPFLVSILIAGADGKIDRNEVREAIRVVDQSFQSEDSSLARLMHTTTEDFEDKLKVLIRQYPKAAEQRNEMLVHELSGLNNLWPKFAREFAVEFYNLLLRIARHVAESSGGIMGIRSVGSEEARYVRLEMLKNPAD